MLSRQSLQFSGEDRSHSRDVAWLMGGEPPRGPIVKLTPKVRGKQRGEAVGG